MRGSLRRLLRAEPHELPALGWAFAYFFLLKIYFSLFLFNFEIKHHCAQFFILINTVNYILNNQ